MESLGTITWWGFSPAVDLVSAYAEATEGEVDDNLNVLLVGAGDTRHILKTAAKLYKRGIKRVNFFVIENNIEPIARQIAMLTLACESASRMNLQEKAELYLELLGNLRVRAATASYVSEMCDFFIRLVSDPEFGSRCLPFVKLDELKFRERDALDAVFKMWRAANQAVADSGKRSDEERDEKRNAVQVQRVVNKHGVLERVVPFDAWKCWDLRLREHLAARYDVMSNVFDYDYHMRLQDAERRANAHIISRSEYLDWRKDGVAFVLRDADYNVPNRTLASARVFDVNGDKSARLGYWGDVLVSPFVSLGVESDETCLFKKQNGQHVKSASHVAEYNVKSWLHELTSSTALPYVDSDQPASDAQGASTSSAASDEAPIPEARLTDALQLRFGSLGATECTVTFFSPGTTLEELAKKSKWAGKFDLLYFSSSMVHLLKANEAARLITTTGKSVCLIENVLFIIEVKNEQISEYVSRVATLAQQAGYCAVKPNGEMAAMGTLQFSSRS